MLRSANAVAAVACSYARSRALISDSGCSCTCFLFLAHSVCLPARRVRGPRALRLQARQKHAQETVERQAPCKSSRNAREWNPCTLHAPRLVKRCDPRLFTSKRCILQPFGIDAVRSWCLFTAKQCVSRLFASRLFTSKRCAQARAASWGGGLGCPGTEIRVGQ
eukprot:3740211-Rhodomonas_salina.1